MVCNGIITIETINEAHGKCPVLPKSINFNTGKASTTTLAFNDYSWGNVSRLFTKYTMRITQSTAQIEKATKEFSKSSTCLMDSMSTDNTLQEVQNNNND